MTESLWVPVPWSSNGLPAARSQALPSDLVIRDYPDCPEPWRGATAEGGGGTVSATVTAGVSQCPSLSPSPSRVVISLAATLGLQDRTDWAQILMSNLNMVAAVGWGGSSSLMTVREHQAA